MSNYFTTDQKISLCNAELALWDIDCQSPCKLSPEFQAISDGIDKLNKKNADLSDFCIPLSGLPEKHYQLLRSMNWIDFETGEPLIKHLNEEPYFYCQKYSYRNGITETTHFITTIGYVQLMLIEKELRERFTSEVV